LGTQASEAAQARGLTRALLAEQVGVARMLFPDYEKGKVRLYTDILERIAAALDVSPAKLLGRGPLTDEERVPSLRLMKRLKRIERLAPAQQKALLTTIDMFLKAAEAGPP